MAVYKYVIVLAIACALNGSANADENCKERPSGDPKTCCAMPSKNRAAFMTCAGEKKAANECVTDCIFDSATVFANGDIDKAVLVSACEKYLDGEDPEWSPLYEQAIDTCIARIKEHTNDDTKHKEHKGHHGNCNHKAMMLLHCVNSEIFRNCPANAWTSSDECEAWKTFSSNCPHAHKMHKHHEETAE